MILTVILVIVLAVLSGFFALSEMALMTSRKFRLKQMARTSRRAQVALSLAQNPESFLSTVQVFITLISIGTGASIGASLGDRIAALLADTSQPWLAQYALPIGVVVSIASITFANMLLGELLPKRLALVSPERFAVATAIPMRVLTWIALPFLYLVAIAVAYFASYFAVVEQVGDVSSGGYLLIFWMYQSPPDLIFSLIKGMVMATVIVLVGCYYGYTASGGPVGVGTATAKSMVFNIVAVHIIGMLGTVVFWGANPRAPIGG